MLYGHFMKHHMLQCEYCAPCWIFSPVLKELSKVLKGFKSVHSTQCLRYVFANFMS